MPSVYNNKVKWCPLCGQGWVQILKDIDTGMLFCCCSECECEWNNAVDIQGNNVDSLLTHLNTCDASEEEINERGWTQYLLK